MIRLSRLSDYGIVLMAQLAGRDGAAPHTARDMAAEARLPLPVVSKVLKSLARRGLLVSHRGARGGYSLARPPQQISAAEMIAALEGPIGLTECSAHPGACVQEASCHVREPWQRINAAVRRALADVTLADLAPPAHDDGTIPLSQLGVPEASGPRLEPGGQGR
jgi:FeS assembly SUF system regulator